MSKRNLFLCAVPRESCAGFVYITDQHLPPKAHNSSSEAFKCHARYLKSQGYEQIGPREFRPPDGGPVLVLPKQSKYGGRLRQGKRGDKGATANRYMPYGKRTQGIIY